MNRVQTFHRARPLQVFALAAVLAASQYVARATAGAQDAGVALSLPIRRDICGVPGLSTRDLVAIDPAMVLADTQNNPGWHAPTRVYWGAARATPTRPAALIFGDPLARGCRAMTASSAMPHGPFDGFPGSNDHWHAIGLWGERMIVAVVDEHGQPHSLRDIGEEFATPDDGMDCGIWLAPLAAFPGGNSLMVVSYRSSDQTLHVLTGDGGALRDTYRHAFLGGILRSEPLRVQGPASATPTLLVQTRPSRRAVPAGTNELHWQAATHTFQ